MKTILILTLALAMAATSAVANGSFHESIRRETEKRVRKEIQKRHGSFRWAHAGAVVGWKPEGWAVSWSAQVLHPEKGPLFAPRTWTNDEGRKVVARIIALPTAQAPTTLRFANSENGEFEYNYYRLSLEDQQFIQEAYQAYIRALAEQEKIRSEIVRSIVSVPRSAPSHSGNRVQAQQDSLERRLQAVEAAAAEAELQQRKLERRLEEARELQNLHRQQQRFNNQHYTDW